MHPQVLIIGAGPVGLTMAITLARQGVALRIVEKNTRRTDKSKALVLWPRTLELLDIIANVDAFLEAGHPVHGTRIFADHGELLHVSFDVARSAYKFALMLPQSETERLLEEQLTALGVVVERGTELISFSDGGHAVSALLRTANDGNEQTVSADWMVACDGAHSTVRHGLASATFDGDTLPSNWVLADAVIDGAALPEDITICFSQHGLLALFPIRPGRFRIIAETGAATPDELPEPTLAEIQQLVDARGPAGLKLQQPNWMSRFRINERKVHDYHYGRIFLAGDAAHVHSPAGGQGMNTGMQDAVNLGWKIALVCKGAVHERLLASYSPERSAIGDQVLQNAARLTRIGLVSNPMLRQLRSLAIEAVDHLPSIKQRFVDQMTEVDLTYADSPLTQHPHGASHRPACGARAPDVAVTGPPWQRLYEVLRSGKFAVVSVDAPTARLSSAHQQIACAVSVASKECADYAPGFLYLIRPDAYVLLSTPADQLAPILLGLDAIM